MFPDRLLLLFITAILLSSCITADEPVETLPVPATEAVSVHDAEPVPEPSADTPAEIEIVHEPPVSAEIIIIENLLWASPPDYLISLNEDELPALYFRQIRKADAAAEENEVSEETLAKKLSEPAGESTLPVNTAPAAASSSFLKLLFEKKEQTETEAEPEAAAVPAPAEAPVPDSATVQKAPAAEPVKPVRKQEAVSESPEVLKKNAVVQEVYLMTLSGEGWLLDSYSDAAGNKTDSLKFVGREYFGGDTVFSFYPYRSGFFIVNLRKPDYSTGKTERKTVELEVSALSVPEAPADAVAAVKADIQDAEYQDSEITDSEIITPEEPIKPAVPAAAEDILKAADSLEAAGDCRGAAGLLERGIAEISFTELDGLYFSLGRLYEKCPAVRDERLAISVYRKIVDYYPISIYWIEAKERIKYLERNFINIR